MPEQRDEQELKAVTDCCGRLLPKSMTLVGDTHIPDLCPACQARDGREHDQHRTCDWSRGVECPGRDWAYSGDPNNPVACAPLWWHLTEDHGLSKTSLHGDPRLMHAAAHSFPGVADHEHETRYRPGKEGE